MNRDIIAKQTAALSECGWDAMIAVSPENFTYVAGFVVPSPAIFRWRHTAVLTDRDGGTRALSVDMEETTVRANIGDTEVRVWREFDDDAMPVLADLIKDCRLGSARIGIETDYLPARDMDRLKGLLPSVRWEPAQHQFNRMRQRKTPREIDLLRQLSRLTDEALKTALESVSEGSSEMDLAGALTAAIYRLGAEQFRLMIVATGERSQYPNVGPTMRRLERGDLIRLEIFGMQKGYHAGICRTGVVGEPSAEAERIWANLTACREIVMEAIKPGVPCREVYARFLKKFEELGYAPISFVGHGIGVFLHEEPYLGPNDGSALEAGMVLGIEPLVYAAGRFGLQCKDMVAVSDTGCELLSDVTDVASLFPVN
jgi:ectoine hydrolase